MIKIEDLKVGNFVWSGDSYGYDIVIVTKELHKHKDFPFYVVEVEDVLTKEKDLLGGVVGYEPNFYRITPNDLFGKRYLEFSRTLFNQQLEKSDEWRYEVPNGQD